MGNKKVTKIDATIKLASFDGGIVKKRIVSDGLHLIFYLKDGTQIEYN